MQSEWVATTIGAQATLQRGIDITKAEQRPGRVPVVSSGGVSSYHDTAAVSGPGVVLGRKGVVGSVYFINEDFWPHDTSLWVKDFHGNDPRFVYYFFRSIAPQLAALDVGSANPTLNRNHVHPIPVTWPANRLQRDIAAFLGTLDDRINLLRQTIATLESIAQALFKSWFIDFDPVRAKAEGREPDAMDGATAALFPAEFVESEFGFIPKGWSVQAIDNVAARVAMGPFGSNIKVSTFVEAGVPVLTGACLKGILLEDDDFRFITAEHADRLSGALVGEGDIVITHRGTLGQVSLIPPGASFKTYVLSQSQFFLRANPEATTPEFLAYFLRCPRGQHLLLANASQVGVPSISRPVSYLKSLRITVPPLSVANAFSGVVRSLHERAVAGRRQASSLAHLRDSLLPRLISGRLRLPEAQIQPDEAVA